MNNDSITIAAKNSVSLLVFMFSSPKPENGLRISMILLSPLFFRIVRAFISLFSFLGFNGSQVLWPTKGEM